MPRRPRRSLQGTAFHVMNRAVRGTILFESTADYLAFVRVVREALAKYKVKIIAYCLMPNHWHLVIICESVVEVSRCMQWLEGTHANRWNGAHGTRGRGAVYQGRFKAVPVQKSRSLIRLCRYVERNALRAGLVVIAEAWRWSSIYAYCNKCDDIPLEKWPIPRPLNWVEFVNTPDTEKELSALRDAIRRNHPIGSTAWRAAVAPFVGLTLRRKGRPRGRWTKK